MKAKFSHNAVKMQPKYSHNLVKMQSKCSQISVKIQSNSSQNSVKIQFVEYIKTEKFLVLFKMYLQYKFFCWSGWCLKSTTTICKGFIFLNGEHNWQSKSRCGAFLFMPHHLFFRWLMTVAIFIWFNTFELEWKPDPFDQSCKASFGMQIALHSRLVM